MSNILITGATGNIGFQLIRFLHNHADGSSIVAGVRNIEKAKKSFIEYPNLGFVQFDFENQTTFKSALKNIDQVFLLRPPHISDVEKYFKPLINTIKENHISKIVFLSVQGVETSSIIPHNKIERLIKENGFNYIFLRPSYFMQNLITTLLKDIQTKRKIILPAGSAKFNWVDIENIAELGAFLINNFEKYKNQAFEITGSENLNFKEVTSLINELVDSPIDYKSVNPFHYYSIKKNEGVKSGMIIVMILLHFLPRFQKQPAISKVFEQLTGKKPTNLKSFIEREKYVLSK